MSKLPYVSTYNESQKNDLKTNSKAKWHAHRFGRLYWTGPILEKNHEGAKVVTILLCHPSQYEKRGTHTGQYFVVVLTRKIRNVNEGSTFITSDES